MKGMFALGHVPDALLRDRAGEQEDARHGRRLLADGEVERHDHAEMDRIDSRRDHRRHHDRHHQDDRGRRVQEHPDDEEEDIEDRENGPLLGRDGEHRRRDALRKLHLREVEAEQGRGGDQQHHGAGLHRPVDDRVAQPRPVELAIDQPAHQESGDDGERRAFGRRDQAAEDAAEDDDGQRERPERVLEGAPELAPFEDLLHRPVEPDRVPVAQAHEAECGEQAGHDARDEHLHHRSARHDRVEDHRDRRRDDDRQRGRGGGHCGREGARVAALLHGGHDDGRGGGHPRDSRARDLREEHVAQHVHLGESAPHPADERLAEVDQPVRDPRGVHDRGGEDEERDRDQRKAGRALVERERHVGQARATLGREHRRDRRDAKRHGDRNVDQHQHDHADEDEEADHSDSSTGLASPRASRSTSGNTSSWPTTNRTAPIGIADIA